MNYFSLKQQTSDGRTFVSEFEDGAAPVRTTVLSPDGSVEQQHGTKPFQLTKEEESMLRGLLDWQEASKHFYRRFTPVCFVLLALTIAGCSTPQTPPLPPTPKQAPMLLANKITETRIATRSIAAPLTVITNLPPVIRRFLLSWDFETNDWINGQSVATACLGTGMPQYDMTNFFVIEQKETLANNWHQVALTNRPPVWVATTNQPQGFWRLGSCLE